MQIRIALSIPLTKEALFTGLNLSTAASPSTLDIPFIKASLFATVL
jgi:hypothetical protein